MEHAAIHERIKQMVPAIVLSIGMIGLSACAKDEPAPVEQEFSGSNGDIQNDVSKLIGQLTGVYDEDGNIISHKKSAENKQD